MPYRMWFAMALAIAGSLPWPARAQDAELVKLREEVRQLREAYESRLQALERRLQEAEAKAGKPADAGAPAMAAQAAPEPATSGRTAGENAFNPAISLILNGTMSSLKRDPETYRINGFVPTGGEVNPPSRGLSLGETELALSASVDHLFRGALFLAVAPEGGVDVEEAYVQTLGLGRGFSVKAGRFYNSVGYQNELHAHARDFVDVPLASKVFLGGQLADDGFQVKWVAPTDLYFALGAEAGRGRRFPGGPDGGQSKNGFGAGTLFAHLGGDLGASTAWRAGASYLRASPRDRSYENIDSTGASVTNSFSGHSRLWALDGILKWAPNGNAAERNFKLLGEYFWRSEDGSLTYDTQGASLGTQSGSYRSRQSGWYAQGVYQFMPQWRAGYRYDRLNAGTTAIGLVSSGALGAADFPILGSYNPRRNTLMVDWSPSEFSRLRLQFARDASRLGEPDNQVFLQYIMSLGAHGAHKF
jgi:hypothetical protein